MRNNMKIKRNQNTISLKLKNKRIAVTKLENGYAIETLIVDGDTSPRTIHKVHKGKAVYTAIKYTNEAMQKIVESYIQLAILDDINNRL
jgi:DNA-binding beta-propeller fold protein YncE